VSALEDTVIDWEQSFEAIADELGALVSVNDLAPPGSPKARKPKAGWGKAGERALNAWWGEKGTRVPYDRPRDVLLVGGLRTGALVTMHAVKGSRPDWREEGPLPYPVPASSRRLGSRIPCVEANNACICNGASLARHHGGRLPHAGIASTMQQIFVSLTLMGQ